MVRAICGLLLFGLANLTLGEERTLHEQATDALRRASDFFAHEVADHGGYLWRYSEDLSKREGESRVARGTVWVQPPGTPSVGRAFLDAYEATDDKRYLSAAVDVGMCLVQGQLESGGWDYRIEFGKSRRRYAYRLLRSERSARNRTTLDDNTTQAALRFLMRLDRLKPGKFKEIHEAVAYGLSALLKAQYPNGAWPQRYEQFPEADKFPVKKASYPESWPRVFPSADYRGYYTFNDNAIADMIDVMFIAAKTYKDDRYAKAAERAGDFILSAQLPDPQPAWAQQYNLDMHPAWARRFEPPAVTGGESQGVMLTLMHLYRETGKRKYLEPIPRAIQYLRRSRLSDGRLARFYELRTNKPLYFTKDYKLTYKDDDLPTHYGFKVSQKLDAIEASMRRLINLPVNELNKREAKSPARVSESLKGQVKSVIAALDNKGRWVKEDRLKYHGADDDTRRIIDCRTFIRNVGILSRYLAATK